MSAELYSPTDALAFRRYAMRKYRRPAVDIRDLSDDPSGDFLHLALLSIREHFRMSSRARDIAGSSFAVYPAYLDDISPNAFAGLEGKLYVCGVHVGMAAAVFEFSLFCFSQRTLFNSIGEPDRERSPPSIDGYPPGFWMREKAGGASEPDFLAGARTIVPADPDRYQAAIALTCLMIRFVWLHELYHCLNGHVGWLADQDTTFSLNERVETPPDTVTSDIIRLLEFDADQSAFYALCRVALEGVENIELLRGYPAETSLCMSVFGAYATTWMLDEYWRRRGSADEDHPDPYHRLQNLVRTFASNVAPNLPNPSGTHDEVMAEFTQLSRVCPSVPSGDRIIEGMRATGLQGWLDRRQRDLDDLRFNLQGHRFTA